MAGVYTDAVSLLLRLHRFINGDGLRPERGRDVSTFKSSALAAAAARVWGSAATAAPLDLSAVVVGDHAQITVSVGSFADLISKILEFSSDPDAAVSVQDDAVIGLGLSFAYDSAWSVSPYRSGSVILPFGSGRADEVSDAGPKFGLLLGDLSPQPVLSDGLALVRFNVDLPVNGSGMLRLIYVNLTPHSSSVDGGLLEAAGLPSVVVGVPEPSTYLMMLLGVAGLGMFAARRRRQG